LGRWPCGSEPIDEGWGAGHAEHVLSRFQRSQRLRERTRGLAICFGICALTLPAAADVALPHGYVEPCAVSFVQDSSTSCELCSPSEPGQRSCGEQLAQRGYEMKCRTGAHSAHGEVWCIAKRAEPATARSSYALLLAAMVGLAVAGAFLWLKRRRRLAR
jgi:LPXTG-motif cell wall-anchored protein